MISDLRLQHFRSYQDEFIAVAPGVNIIVGPNASGKTNMLEAILVLCRGNSYRAPDRELIEHNADWARLDAKAFEQDRVVKLQLQGELVKKDYTIGGTNLKRLTMQRTIPVVLFEPSHMQLLTDSPELRRNFLDDIIEQTIPAYGEYRRNYKRALSQRNSLLKQSFTHDQLFVWNVRLSELGGQIAEARNTFIQDNQDALQELYGRLVNKKIETRMVHQTNLDTKAYASSMLKGLEARLNIDRERGYTTIGPHRDDLGLELNGYPLASAASRGETRTMLLALKVLEVHSLEKARGVKPILLLDDVFSELDASRRRALTTHLQGYQTFITTTDADAVLEHFNDDNTNLIPAGRH